MMQRIIWTLVCVLVLALGINAFASSEKVLGPVVAVERSYDLDLNKLEKALTPFESGSGFFARVEVYPLNGTEQVYGADDPVEMKVGLTLVKFYANGNGYSATLRNEGSKQALSSEQAVLALRSAFERLEASRRTLIVRLTKLQ